MIRWLIYGMIYAGSALMVYNIVGFTRFVRYIQKRGNWENNQVMLYIPVILLCLFLLGYLGVGLFGKPDLLVAGILFGGSIFVFAMYRLLNRITAKIIENEHLESKLLAAQESNRVKNNFLATISHEMRTPLNVILGLDTLALHHSGNSPEMQEELEKIGYSSRYLLNFVNNVLDMQDMENGQLTVHEEPFSVTGMLERLREISCGLGRAKGIEVHFHADDGVPERVNGDGHILDQVLMNLLDNAVKFTERGRVDFTADVPQSDAEGYILQFTVRDTGIGMSPEFLGRAFEPLTKEDSSSTTKYRGTGLGLTVTRDRVHLLGGEIRVQSEKGKGSVFTVMVPMKRVQTEQEKEQDMSLENRRILIAEDIRENAEIVADLLEEEGALSEHAENGQVALSMFRASPAGYYDAILMDLRMPVMDGLESVRRIRALDRPDARSVPIIALTANAFDSDVSHSLEAGMNEHLVKPIDADLLYATLKKWVRRMETAK
ncbi:MAG: response regulator [Clostridia bacterium]|nr:response regulator [Clostridia bacterium]